MKSEQSLPTLQIIKLLPLLQLPVRLLPTMISNYLTFLLTQHHQYFLTIHIFFKIMTTRFLWWSKQLLRMKIPKEQNI